MRHLRRIWEVKVNKKLVFLLITTTLIVAEPITYIIQGIANGDIDQVVVDVDSGTSQDIRDDIFILSVFADTSLEEDGGFVNDGQSTFSGLNATIQFSSIPEIFTFDEPFSIQQNFTNFISFIGDPQSNFDIIAQQPIHDGETLNPIPITDANGTVRVLDASANNGSKLISLGSLVFSPDPIETFKLQYKNQQYQNHQHT